jgi:hypothetical protein
LAFVSIFVDEGEVEERWNNADGTQYALGANSRIPNTEVCELYG